MSTLRSEGWSVHPSFVPHGPTAPVTLLFDESGLTQLAGVYPVAWQTSWGEVTDLQLSRVSRAMTLIATIAGVRYSWRHRDLADYEALRALVVEHGGVVTRRRRGTGVYVVVAVVLLASFAGSVAAWFTSDTARAQELRDARAVNLSLNDLPSGWTTVPSSVLEYIIPPSNQVLTSTPTTAAPSSSWRRVSAQFQRCMGVNAASDRIYGAAGQMPDYQVSSPVFRSASFRGIELASTVQYYATTTMVRRDVAEMSQPRFGACFSASNAVLLLAGGGVGTPRVASGSNWHPLTYLNGWARGGQVVLAVPGVSSPLHLVMVVTTSGHYEVTLGALVARWPQSQYFLAALVNTLKARMSSRTSAAV